ncbi:MAG: hypothetical protein IRZ05_18695, partial [Micromonosporaceae bacterium]|nr:hypothetical protein [Micromonosporaceae bacterium]
MPPCPSPAGLSVAAARLVVGSASGVVSGGDCGGVDSAGVVADAVAAPADAGALPVGAELCRVAGTPPPGCAVSLVWIRLGGPDLVVTVPGGWLLSRFDSISKVVTPATTSSTSTTAATTARLLGAWREGGATTGASVTVLGGGIAGRVPTVRVPTGPATGPSASATVVSAAPADPATTVLAKAGAATTARAASAKLAA